MKRTIVLLASLTAGCASSEYAVTPNTSEIKAEITVGAANDKLVSVRQDGKWFWRKKPEEVVLVLYKVILEMGKQLDGLKAQAAGLQTALDAAKTSCVIAPNYQTLQTPAFTNISAPATVTTSTYTKALVPTPQP